LTPEEHEAILQSVQEYEDLQYVNAFKKEHVARSIVEVNGASLREYDFIEVEVEEFDSARGEVFLKTVSLERHKFVLDYVLATWSREAIDTVFRKFNEVIAKSERVATEGVEFTIPEESPEDKYRRLLVEAKDIEGHIPVELVNNILNEVGYMSKATKEDLEKIDQKLSQIAQEEPKEAVEVPPKHETPKEVQKALKGRKPLNQMPMEIPQPPQERSNRSKEIEEIEGDILLTPELPVQGNSRLVNEVPILDEKAPKVNPREIETILDKPPVAGINPRYKSHRI
jgi:hypothetical protein